MSDYLWFHILKIKITENFAEILRGKKKATSTIEIAFLIVKIYVLVLHC